jgi:putative FmdB family regulatory protein
MPTYQYECKNCGHTLEEFQSITEPPLLRCPNCHTDSLARILGSGAGLIFKGSGFYLTDYKKPRPESAKPEKKETPPAAKPSGKPSDKKE